MVEGDEKARYSRALLKLSGEAIGGKGPFSTDPQILSYLSGEIKQAHSMGVQMALVVGGGNIGRGTQASSLGMDRATADYAGMLATVINALALQSALERAGLETRTQSAITIQAVAEPYIRRRAIRHLEKGRIVLLAGGTGNPYVTTDTAAALRAVELQAQVLLMAKNGVDGVYDADPRENPRAKRFSRLSHQEALRLQLGVMDTSAFALCQENSMPILVFDISREGNLRKALLGEPVGTLVAGFPD